MKYILITVAVLAFSSASAYGTTFAIGMEDTQVGGDHDYNDLIAKFSGSVTVHTTGVFTSLTDATLSQSASPFWNNLSQDGAGMNIGNFVLGDGGFSGGPIIAAPQYL